MRWGAASGELFPQPSPSLSTRDLQPCGVIWKIHSFPQVTPQPQQVCRLQWSHNQTQQTPWASPYDLVPSIPTAATATSAAQLQQTHPCPSPWDCITFQKQPWQRITARASCSSWGFYAPSSKTRTPSSPWAPPSPPSSPLPPCVRVLKSSWLTDRVANSHKQCYFFCKNKHAGGSSAKHTQVDRFGIKRGWTTLFDDTRTAPAQ